LFQQSEPFRIQALGFVDMFQILEMGGLDTLSEKGVTEILSLPRFGRSNRMGHDVADRAHAGISREREPNHIFPV